MVAGLFFFLKHEQSERARSAREAHHLLAKEEDLCTNKKFCAMVYVAPWCPACKQMAERHRTALTKARDKKDYGFKVIVGQGRKEENEAEAAALGLGAVVDADNKWQATLHVDRFPSYYVLDQEGTVILQDNEAFQWIGERFF